MSKPVIADSVSEIAAGFKADVGANKAKLEAELNSMFNPKASFNRKVSAASQPSAGKIGGWTPLPKHNRDECDFHERLSIPLLTTTW